MQLLSCVSHFDTGVPDAYCVYTPLAVASLSHVINAYTPDIAAKLALFADYLTGLSFLHDKKGIMHRDISPGNLAITSLYKPRGIIIDLDAATTLDASEDHLNGTIPFLAPEIMDLKRWEKEGKQGQQPPLYGRSVDTWALGLAIYALHAGQPFRWAQFVNGPMATTHVTRYAHVNFQNKINQDSQSAKDPAIRELLISIGRMTRYGAQSRASAADRLANILAVQKGQGRGTIESNRKRPWEG